MFHRSTRAEINPGIATIDLLDDGDRPQAGRCHQHGDYFAVPDVEERIGSPPLPGRFADWTQVQLLLKEIDRRRAEPALAPAIAGVWVSRSFMKSFL